MVPMLGIVFIAIGRVRWTARATAGICIAGHIAVAVPIIAGWLPDRGVLTTQYAAQLQLWAAEILIVGFLISGYALGRWARSTSATAVAELQQAMRVIGDREQALAEVVDQARRANRANEGRWTNQTIGIGRPGRPRRRRLRARGDRLSLPHRPRAVQGPRPRRAGLPGRPRRPAAPERAGPGIAADRGRPGDRDGQGRAAAVSVGAGVRPGVHRRAPRPPDRDRTAAERLGLARRLVLRTRRALPHAGRVVASRRGVDRLAA